MNILVTPITWGKYNCDNGCEHVNITSIEIENLEFNLCDDCLQELNRKIVEHLADKNI